MMPSIPPHLHDLGSRLAITEVAALFEVAETTVKRHYRRYGRIKPGRTPLFFEKLVSEAVRSYYATQAHTARGKWTGQWLGQVKHTRATHPQALPHQEGARKPGKSR